MAAFPPERGGGGCSWVETSQALVLLSCCVWSLVGPGRRAGGRGVGALLGPEGTGPSRFPGLLVWIGGGVGVVVSVAVGVLVRVSARAFLVGGCGCWAWRWCFVGRGVFVNWIVDASI